MNLRIACHILGGLLCVLGLTLLIPIVFSLLDGDSTWVSFLISATSTFFLGLFAYYFFKKKKIELNHRDAFGIVTLSWILFSIVGALPYVLTGAITGWVNPFFEAMSGFTTTGATVITDLSVVPRSVLFWRSFTQWLGGMGIIVLSMAILPFLGVGGMQLFYAEAPGPTKDRLTPRIQDTAKLLWGVYFLFTFVQFLLLSFGGMGTFDAICHSLTTVATGGFSTKNASIAEFENSFIHWTIIVFMILGGVNFTLHYQAFRGNLSKYFKSQEFIFYISVIFLATAFITVANHSQYESLGIAIRDSAFQVSALISSTGFVTADYEIWPYFSQFILMILMLMGGCAGSTSGGMKVIRIFVVIKYTFNQLFQLIHPRGVKSIKVDHAPVSNSIIQNVLGFAALYFGCWVLGTLLLTLTDTDLPTAMCAVLSALSNIGPAFGTIGPTENYAHLSPASKLILSFCMLIGRLEFYTAILIFLPSFHRRS